MVIVPGTVGGYDEGSIMEDHSTVVGKHSILIHKTYETSVTLDEHVPTSPCMGVAVLPSLDEVEYLESVGSSSAGGIKPHPTGTTHKRGIQQMASQQTVIIVVQGVVGTCRSLLAQCPIRGHGMKDNGVSCIALHVRHVAPSNGAQGICIVNILEHGQDDQ